MPDDRRFGVIWLGREALQGAFGLEGAFNEVSVSLLRGTDPQTVIERLDDMLGRYGGVGAYPRADQLSNWFLANEIEQLRTLASILPTVFLLVAALLTRMVLARLVAVERSEIGLLKAFGYRNRDIAVHYVKLVIAIGAVGVVGGWLVGFWLGRYETRLYADFYRFPFLLYHPGPRAFVIAAAVSLGSALAGALGAVREAAALSPAQAMQPPAPPLFRRAAVAEWSVGRRLDQPTRIVLRQILRRPGRSLATSAGIGLAVAVLMVSMQWLDAIRHMVDVYFLQAQAQDVTVGFADPRSAEVLQDLARLPGVQTTEPARVVSAKLRFGSREQREAAGTARAPGVVSCTTRRVAVSICRPRGSSSPRCSRTSLACGAATASPSKCSKAGGRSWIRSWSSSKPTSARRPTSSWERSRACFTSGRASRRFSYGSIRASNSRCFASSTRCRA